MLESKRSKPCFYLGAKADVTELMALRPKLRKSRGVKITTNVFYIYALAKAVKAYPLTVGRIEGDSIKIAECINVGFAVQAPHGLVVPVIKNADQKNLSEIAILEKTLTEKALDNQLTLEEIEAETVALSNLGPYGIDSFVGIVPPLASTILSVGNAISTVVPRNGKIVTRKMVSLSVAADYRVIRDTYAAKFLNYIKNLLQNPHQLV
jgi:pyruvate dehydrogenase E2 component (dihydrolipoamide acetyltransferase)